MPSFGGGPMTTDGVNLYMNDEFNWAIRKIDVATGTVSTLFGSLSQRLTENFVLK